MNLNLMAAPKTVADGAQTVASGAQTAVKAAKGDRKARKRFNKNKDKIVRVTAVSGTALATAIVLGARRRRKALVGKTVGALTGRNGDLNDPALARKVESEIFRAEDAPKGSVNVNAENGVIYLRGEVKHPEDIKALGDAARKVAGVKEVKNLLHTPGSEAKMKE